MSREWQLFYGEILHHSKKILKYSEGLNFGEIFADQILVDAILWNILVIGEAANQIPNDIRTELPDVPWRNIISMRNQVVHVYFGLNNNILWSVIKTHLPQLISQLEQFKRDHAELFHDDRFGNIT
ncbi:MAG: DUF86 domain-containing protein [Alphaproteobacteria bacterium]|nr:DUF86 domain-containing protein [Alphaproteobacteria bacterium]